MTQAIELKDALEKTAHIDYGVYDHQFKLIREAAERQALMRESVDVKSLKKSLLEKYVPHYGDTNAVLRDRADTDGYIQHTHEIVDELAKLGLLRTGWMPIESAPKDGEDFIGRIGSFVFLTAWDDEDEEFFSINQFYEQSYYAKKFGPEKWTPTHWMPLPPAAQKDTP